MFVGSNLRSLDLTDDRLESLLRYLNKDKNWNLFEAELSRSILKVYDIKPEQVRARQYNSKQLLWGKFTRFIPMGL